MAVHSAARGSYDQVDVATTATLLAAANPARQSILVRNNDTGDLYVGFDDDVTTSDGFIVKAGESLDLDDYRGDLYGIASAADTDVRVLEVGTAA